MYLQYVVDNAIFGISGPDYPRMTVETILYMYFEHGDEVFTAVA